MTAIVCQDTQRPFGLGEDSGFSTWDFRFMNWCIQLTETKYGNEQQGLGLLKDETDTRTLIGKMNMCPTKCPRLESQKKYILKAMLP